MALKYIIIEDEGLSAERLATMISRMCPDFQLETVLDSVKSSISWLTQNQQPDVAFFDIQLADGLSFDIFDHVYVPFPVIFTTAYNEYAIRAFKVNSIDYLLKPVDEAELKVAIAKFRSGLSKSGHSEHEAVALALSQLTSQYKSRFVIKIGDHLKMIHTDEVAYFFSAEKSVFIRTFANRDYGVGYTLEQIESLLNPSNFCRVSRKYIVNMKAISDIVTYTNSRLKLKLAVQCDEDILVSRDRLDGFRNWLEGSH